jgi:hypothetical protein
MSIEKGFYKGRAIKGAEQYGTSSKGNDQIVIDLDLGEHGQVSTVLNFSDAAAPYAVQRLRALGWKGDDITNLQGIEINEVDVRVFYETYEGKERMKAEISTGGGRIKLETPMDPRAKSAFGARMKAFLRGTGQSAPRSAPTNQQDNSDIPF